jgi:hypothetical protein
MCHVFVNITIAPSQTEFCTTELEETKMRTIRSIVLEGFEKLSVKCDFDVSADVRLVIKQPESTVSVSFSSAHLDAIAELHNQLQRLHELERQALAAMEAEEALEVA